MLLLGCSNVLGIPDDPYVLPPDAAAFEPSSSATGEADVGDVGAVTTSSPSDAATMDTPLGPSVGIITDSTDGGVVIGVAPDQASSPPSIEVMSTGESSPPPGCPPIQRALISDFAFL